MTNSLFFIASSNISFKDIKYTIIDEERACSEFLDKYKD